jgi:hypothetical protein
MSVWSAIARQGARWSWAAATRVEQPLASIGAEITRAEQALERYYEAFEQGKLSPERCEQTADASRRASTTSTPRRPNSPSRGQTTPDRRPHRPELGAVADELERVIAEAEPKKAKALLRVLIEELRVNGRAEILPTYCVIDHAVCAMSEKWRRRESNPRPRTHRAERLQA